MVSLPLPGQLEASRSSRSQPYSKATFEKRQRPTDDGSVDIQLLRSGRNAPCLNNRGKDSQLTKFIHGSGPFGVNVTEGRF
jgi:hypothetical protein